MDLFSELKTLKFWKSVLAEYLALLFFVFLTCGTATDLGPYPHMHIALQFGLSIATLAAAIGDVSGGAINPAVSITLMVTRRVSILRGFAYVIAQVIGGITGAAILYGLTPAAKRGGLGVTSLGPGVTAGQGFGIELMLTFLLLFTIFAVTDKGRGLTGYQPPLAIGFCILVCHLVGIQYTGCGINPARSFGPAAIMDSWDDHWIYWVGPILGGILGGVIYELLFSTEEGKTLLKKSSGNPNVFDMQEPKTQEEPGRV